MTVEVFKTNVHKGEEAAFLLGHLCAVFPAHKINFDLDDCDRILRVEGVELRNDQIIDILREQGYNCEVLS